MLSASGTSPQEGTGDEKGSVKGQRGLGRPSTSEDGNIGNSGFIFLNKKRAHSTNNQTSASLQICAYASSLQASSSAIIRAPGSAVSKMPSEAQSFSIFDKISAVQKIAPGPGYCPSSMTKSSNKGQTVGEKYSGIEFLQTPGRTPASGSPLGGTPSPRYKILRPGTASHPPGKGRLPIRRTFHISEYGRV
ncbi:hypothetical protein F2Q70_00004303 [Brassica cretica]|uniref:Uncharacterized protein n=1 Tax=Brassica cretica TaxID=69181 RepID=A0A8S9ITK9_BRACR|nr:hypothetical protein F2Q70_00004303 [Brassica cretica]